MTTLATSRIPLAAILAVLLALTALSAIPALAQEAEQALARFPTFEHVVELIRAGAIGPVGEVHVWLGADFAKPPVPDAGKMNAEPASVFSTFFTPSSAGCRISAKAAERWSIVGMSQALRRLSGILVGPGMNTGF